MLDEHPTVGHRSVRCDSGDRGSTSSAEDSEPNRGHFGTRQASTDVEMANALFGDNGLHFAPRVKVTSAAPPERDTCFIDRDRVAEAQAEGDTAADERSHGQGGRKWRRCCGTHEDEKNHGHEHRDNKFEGREDVL